MNSIHRVYNKTVNMLRGLILICGGFLLELLIGDKALLDTPKIIILKYLCFIAICLAGCLIPVPAIQIIMTGLICITIAIAVITSYLE